MQLEFSLCGRQEARAPINSWSCEWCPGDQLAGRLPFHPASSLQPWWRLSEKINWRDSFCYCIFTHHHLLSCSFVPLLPLLLIFTSFFTYLVLSPCSFLLSLSSLLSFSIFFFFCPFPYRLAKRFLSFQVLTSSSSRFGGREGGGVLMSQHRLVPRGPAEDFSNDWTIEPGSFLSPFTSPPSLSVSYIHSLSCGNCGFSFRIKKKKRYCPEVSVDPWTQNNYILYGTQLLFLVVVVISVFYLSVLENSQLYSFFWPQCFFKLPFVSEQSSYSHLTVLQKPPSPY